MKFLADLDEMLVAALRRADNEAFSNASLAPNWRPLIDLSHGDLSTDILTRLGALRRESPEILYGQLVQELPVLIRTHAALHEGIIYLRCVEGSFFEHYGIERTSHPGFNRPHVIVVPRPSQECRGISYLRLLSMAFIQYSILLERGAAVSLFVGNECISMQHAASDREEFFSKTFASAFESKSAAPSTKAEFEAIIAANEESAVTVWIFPDCISHRDFTALYAAHFANVEWRQLRCPQRPFLGSFEAEGDEKLCRSLSEEDRFALLVYLSQPIPMRDIFIGSAFRESSPNLLWFTKSTLMRLGTRRDSEGKQTTASVRLSKDALLRFNPIIHRLLFIERFYERAGLYGEVSEFSTALFQILEKVNWMMNEEKAPFWSKDPDLTALKAQIFAGVELLFSDSIVRNEFYRPLRGLSL